jgi:hypothetical protein
MTDPIANSDVESPVPPIPSTPAPPLPPPALPDSPEPAGQSRLRILAAVAAIGLAAAVAFGLMWMQATGSRDDANAARDAAIAERNANVENGRVAADALIDTQSDLSAAQADNQRLQGDLDSALEEIQTADSAPVATTTPIDTARVDELETEVDELSTTNDALADQLTTLQAELDAAAATPETPAEFDIAAAPEFARYVGEVLSSRSGSSRLAAAQSTCFGTEIINSIGLDALGNGLHNAASSSDNNAVIGAMQGAASTCGIDPGLIF